MLATPQQRQAVTLILAEQAAVLANAAAKLYVQFLPFGDEARPAKVYALEQELRSHVQPLADSVLMDSVSLVQAHFQHARYLAPGPSNGRDVELQAQLSALRQILRRHLPISDYSLTDHYLRQVMQALGEPLPRTSDAEPTKPPGLSALAAEYLNLLLAGQRAAALKLMRRAAKDGTAVHELYLSVFQPVQREVGRLWHQGKISVAQEHYCTAATELAMAQLHPYLMKVPRNGRRLVATTLAGDLHGMPVRIVSDFLEAEGWESYFLGASTPAESVWSATVAYNADLIIVGASMSHHVAAVRELISARQEDPARADVKIVVGGAPFNADPQLWQAVGADGWAPDAWQAIEQVNRLFAAPHSSSKSRPSS
ncbi:cobalamin-dependent protein [Hymenobacter sp. BT175]|uniref:cobalamin B12-binding domain-containing protein n=1 Tax=Hymenobacter translucens TaxID=2886507 RepID=UPI001D0F08D9|nr:cobalamin-dependent protein [Hymenobacter translucens]MCC2545280.1 cobalamin-dependent protein [Hymenobacter translucens]